MLKLELCSDKAPQLKDIITEVRMRSWPFYKSELSQTEKAMDQVAWAELPKGYYDLKPKPKPSKL